MSLVTLGLLDVIAVESIMTVQEAKAARPVNPGCGNTPGANANKLRCLP